MAASSFTKEIRSSEDLEEAFVDLFGAVTFLTVDGADDCDVEMAGEALVGLFADCSVDTFEGSGVLTANDGLVLRTRDGAEFQITIVRSR